MFGQTRLFFAGSPVFMAVPFDDVSVWRAFARNKAEKDNGLKVADVLRVYAIISGDESRLVRAEARGRLNIWRGPIETGITPEQMNHTVRIRSFTKDSVFYNVSRNHCDCPDFEQNAAGLRGHGEICKHQCHAIEQRMI
jgi:hypothetical protein